MLPQKFRLTREEDFKRIRNKGRSFFSTHLRLRYLVNNLGLNRFAVVVSTKVSKKATQRNRLKRQLREILRLNKAKIKPGHDIIVSASIKALNRKYQDLEQNILAVLAKARLFK